MMVWRVLSAMNRWFLPSIHKVPDLTRLNGFQKAIVGWKMWVTYRHLEALKKKEESPLKGENLPL